MNNGEREVWVDLAGGVRLNAAERRAVRKLFRERRWDDLNEFLERKMAKARASRGT